MGDDAVHLVALVGAPRVRAREGNESNPAKASSSSKSATAVAAALVRALLQRGRPLCVAVGAGVAVRDWECVARVRGGVAHVYTALLVFVATGRGTISVLSCRGCLCIVVVVATEQVTISSLTVAVTGIHISHAPDPIVTAGGNESVNTNRRDTDSV